MNDDNKDSGITHPPIGIIPRHLATLKRMSELNAAIKRYLDAGLDVDPLWTDELHDLTSSVKMYEEDFKASIRS